MQRISITLNSEETAALIESARMDYRHPREQVRYMVRLELERRGLLAAVGSEQATANEVSNEP